MSRKYLRSGRELAPCGTPAAYRRHLRHGDPPCAICLQAERLRTGERYGSDPWNPTQAPDRRAVRNGLPEFRPYVYRGLGYDQHEEEPCA